MDRLRNYMKHLFALVITVFSLNSFAQYDKVELINGKVLTGRITSVTSESINVRMFHKGQKIDRIIDKYRVFALNYEEGKRQILYSRDTTAGRDYTVKQLERLIKGEQDAIKGHKTFVPLALSAIGGGSGGYILGPGNFLILGVPFIAMLSSAVLIHPTIKKSAVRDEQLLNDKLYKKGYKRIAKSKRNKQVVIGSIAGTVLGAIIKAVDK